MGAEPICCRFCTRSGGELNPERFLLSRDGITRRLVLHSHPGCRERRARAHESAGRADQLDFLDRLAAAAVAMPHVGIEGEAREALLTTVAERRSDLGVPS